MAPASNFRIYLTHCLAGACLLLAACNPAFNWREVRPDNTALSLLLPCKPDKATRNVPLGGQQTELAMLGCDTGGATFALAVATVPDTSQLAALLAGWRAATLVNMKATGTGQATPLKVPGASVLPPPALVRAEGRRADGSGVQSQAAYFAHGGQIFQAVIYADKISPEVSETFFSSFKLDSGSARP
ncbi:hypothetical protein [Polaromonas sp.]|uniref:hypothetical protein n=1 Tax=Polaromonas sp. TaxID=1869339 RepID=UPI002730123A|nr:hypothetical protein [Polaromonas sp.]MDP1742045.1 hypothetical protein [Polaromonas sp.]